VRLDKTALHHIRKLRDPSPGRAAFYKRLLDDLHTSFKPADGGYPAYLSVEDQGLFVLGYHQMRHWLWMSKEARAAWSAEHGLAPTLTDNAEQETMEGEIR